MDRDTFTLIIGEMFLYAYFENITFPRETYGASIQTKEQ